MPGTEYNVTRFFSSLMSLFAFSQVVTFQLSSSFRISMRSSRSLCEQNMLVSSAKRSDSVNVQALGRSLIYSVKRSGPSMEP